MRDFATEDPAGDLVGRRGRPRERSRAAATRYDSPSATTPRPGPWSTSFSTRAGRIKRTSMCCSRPCEPASPLGRRRGWPSRKPTSSDSSASSSTTYGPCEPRTLSTKLICPNATSPSSSCMSCSRARSGHGANATSCRRAPSPSCSSSRWAGTRTNYLVTYRDGHAVQGRASDNAYGYSSCAALRSMAARSRSASSALAPAVAARRASGEPGGPAAPKALSARR